MPRAARPIGPEALVVLLEGGLDRVVLIDCRPFVDYNTCHILEALNVNGSKLMKRRLQQDKVQIAELLQHRGRNQLRGEQEVVVYDQNSSDPASLGADSFLSVLLGKLESSFPSVHLLSGGFCGFSQLFPGLCEGKSVLVPAGPAQPGPAVSSLGPTRILPHLYLGCQRDVLNRELMQQNGISFVLNASNTCPKPDFVPESHFLRVPVNDSFCEKILPWLDRSLDFIEEAKASDGRVLVHCLAGISRSATIAIAYIMKRMDLSLDEAYRFVKEKRPTISPNFNFLGQLLDFEKNIKSPDGSESRADRAGQQGAEPPSAPPPRDPAEQLAEALGAAQLADGSEVNGSEDGARLKRCFSLDIKAFGEPGAGAAHQAFRPHAGPGTRPGTSSAHRADDFYKVAASSTACQFSPVEEVSEQSTPEPSPDREEDRASGPDRDASPGSSSAPTDQPGSSSAPTVSSPAPTDQPGSGSAPTDQPGSSSAPTVSSPAPTDQPSSSSAPTVSSSAPTDQPGSSSAPTVSSPAPTDQPGRSSAPTVSSPAPTDQPGRSSAPNAPTRPQRCGSMEDSGAGFLLGLSCSPQHPIRPGSGSGSGSGSGPALKGWHSDLLLAPVPVSVSGSSLAAGWFMSSETTRFYSSGSVLSGAGFGPPGRGAAGMRRAASRSS